MAMSSPNMLMKVMMYSAPLYSTLLCPGERDNLMPVTKEVCLIIFVP
jgi:hypothetical protein